MKRIVVLIDGTWCDEDSQFDTNIAKLDPSNAKIKPPLTKPQAADGTLQKAFYHPGVGEVQKVGTKGRRRSSTATACKPTASVWPMVVSWKPSVHETPSP